MSAAFHILIPARLASTRLARKPLAMLGGKALIVRVLEQALKAGARSVHVATDSTEIASLAEAAGGSVVMTAGSHLSGTDRLAEAADALGLAGDEIVVNLQGDEPLMPTDCLRQVADLLAADRQAQMATLWSPLLSEAEWRNPNVVKLVTDARGRALYFSRAPIPHPRGRDFRPGEACRHIGLYAYRVAALKDWATLPPSPLESAESLEQLRALSAGWTIACAQACAEAPTGIDTPEDLARIQSLFDEPDPARTLNPCMFPGMEF